MNEYPLEPRTSYTIRFSDCDPYGHLNNSKYIDYFHNARMDHLFEIYRYEMKEYVQAGFGFVVGSQEIFYFKPALCYEKVWIQSSVIRMDESRISVEFVMTDEHYKEIKAIMWTEYWGINLQTGKPENMPQGRKDFFSKIINSSIRYEGGIRKRYKELKEQLNTSDK